jgi:catechol 2,3-dioxygenase-like lactoylglutathione lyase family enzyme
LANETGSGISHVMLGVTDVERSTKFYEETLGRPVRFKTDGLVFIDAGSITIGLNRGLANLRQPVAGAMELVFAVASVRESFRALRAKGVSFVVEPRQATDKEWVATFADPDGHYLTLFGPAGE